MLSRPDLLSPAPPPASDLSFAALHALAASQAAAVARSNALLAVADALVRAATPDDVARVVVEQGAAALGAARGAVALVVGDVAADGVALEVVAATGYSAEALAAYRRVPLASAFPLSDVVRSGEPILLATGEERRARYPHLARLTDENGDGAMAAVPLLVPPAGGDGEPPQVVGALGLNFPHARTFTADDRALLLALGQQCAQAVERARLYAAERAARQEAELARARAEAERERAREANRAKGQFLATMSHELRTPLNAIAGYVQLVDMGLHGPVTEAQHDAFARIARAQRHLLGLITDVLDFAKVESGRVEYDVREVAVADVFAAVAPLVEPLLAAKRLALEMRPHAGGLPNGPPNGPPNVPLGGAPHEELRVWADRAKLVQVLVNLLSNAAKFTPDGGRVGLSVATRFAGPDGGAAGGRPGVAFLRVTDTGIGIPRDKQAAIFEPFVQVRGGYARAHEGTGLGLAISRDLARGMGGDLRVRSREGVGSTFTVTLRLAGEAATGEAAMGEVATGDVPANGGPDGGAPPR